MKERKKGGKIWYGKETRKGRRGLEKVRWCEKREETVLEHVREEDQDGGGERMNQERERGKDGEELE